jgi:soluble lytic murein transglycosylase-like protein
VAAAERYGVDGLLLAAIVRHESSFDPEIVSPKGAVGLMQLLPSTGRAYGAEDLFNPGVNLDAGSRYLSHLLALYDGDLELALAAYNAGPTAVARYGGIPPYRETRQYVRRVKAEYERLKDRVNRA